MRPLILVVLLLALPGCGGIEGSCAGFGAGIQPMELSLPAGGQTVLSADAFSCSSTLQSYVWSIQEGPAGGTVSAFEQDGQRFATYFAPQTPGTYHVQIVFRFRDGMELIPVSTVTVTTNPAAPTPSSRS